MWLTTAAADTTNRAARRTARTVTAAATVLFVLVICRWRPWDMFTRGGFSADFYDEQARSFVQGRLAVRPEVAGIEGFAIDGETHLYYGPFLAAARIPFALFDVLVGDVFAGRLTRLSMTIGFAVYCTGAFHLLECARRWASGRWQMPVATTASPWRTGVFVGAAACSPVLFLSGWVSVYHETELWAAVFAVWAAVGAARTAQRPTLRHALMTGVMVAAAITTRASVGLGVAAGTGLVALMHWRRGRHAWTLVLAGSVLGALIHGGVNWARFGSPSALPADRQVLSLVDPARAAWFAGNDGSFFSSRFLPTTLLQYARPDTVRFERLVPFIRYGPLAGDRGSYPMETITPSASLTATATLLCVTAVVGFGVIVRRRGLEWFALTAGAAIGAVPALTIGFVANRYLVDLVPVILVPAAVAAATCTFPARLTSHRRAVRLTAVAAVIWGGWVNVALATWTQNLKEPGFTELRYRLDDLVFDGPAPSLVRIETGVPVPRDGVVGLTVKGGDGRCDAVYIAEQSRWVALERLRGPRRATGTTRIRPRSIGTIATGPGWQLSIESDSTTWRVVLDHDGTVTATVTEAEAAPIPTDVVAAEAEVAVEVEVVNDDVVGQLIVTVDDRIALFRPGHLPGPVAPGVDLHVESPTDSHETLCRRLQDRL